MTKDPLIPINPTEPEARRIMHRVTPPLSEVLVRLGDRIRDLRNRAGLSQAALGGPYISRAAVSAIEKGRATPSLRSLAHIAKQLDVTIAELLSEDDGRQEGPPYA